jgi:hypothetical protein
MRTNTALAREARKQREAEKLTEAQAAEHRAEMEAERLQLAEEDRQADARDDHDAELAKAVAEARTAATVPLADLLREHGLLDLSRKT